MKEFEDEVFDSGIENAEADDEELDDGSTASELAFIRGAEEEIDDPNEEKAAIEEELE